MLSNIGPVQLLIILLIVIAIFGTKKLRTMGSDVGAAVKGFRKAVNEGEDDTPHRNITDAKDADFDSTSTEERSKTGQS